MIILYGDDRSVIATALALLSRTVPSSRSYFSKLVKSVVDELKASQAANLELEKEVEPQKRLVSETEKVENDAFNNVASLREQVAAASTSEV